LIARAKALSIELATPISPGFQSLVFKASRGIVDISELTYVRKNGSRFPAIVSVTALRDAADTIIGFLLVGTDNTARDVTERGRLDEVLREKTNDLQSAKAVAERANLAKSDFLSSMSHELRSPLNAILGFAQLLESDVPAPTLRQKENIGQILQAGWHLLKVIDEILDLAKIESGKLSLSVEAVSLGEVLTECQGMVEGHARTRGIQIAFPLFLVPCFVLADRTRLKQILINLLSNAIKYNRPGGRVEVTWTLGAKSRLRVAIADTGAGLSGELLSRLFEPFNRLGQEAGGQEGTGLGLVMAKQLVELMGGVLGVDSTVGMGSTFWFELAGAAEPQFAVGAEEGRRAAYPRAPSSAPARVILYVEDNPPNLRLVEQLIARRPDLSLLSAMSGTAGITLARTRHPEVVLMDINLPDLNGIEVLRALRNDPATASIPVIAVSANAMPQDIKSGLAAGFFRYLTKPIKVNEFMETLNAALELAKQRAAPSPPKDVLP
jgi:signal transduction histidine kinase/ActR/RegA family two-component response regulator